MEDRNKMLLHFQIALLCTIPVSGTLQNGTIFGYDNKLIRLPYTPDQFSSIDSLSDSLSDFEAILPSEFYYFEIMACEIDREKNILYVYDWGTEKIYVGVNFTMTNEITITEFHRGLSGGLTRLALDWVTNNVYWTDPFYRWIAVQPGVGPEWDRSIFKILIHEDLQRPYGLALDPVERYLFWSNAGTITKIERSALDGSARRVLISSGLLLPYALAVDIAERRVYWVDYWRDSLESSDYDGADRRITLRVNGLNFFDVAIFRDVAVVVDTNHGVFNLNKRTGLLEAETFPQTVSTVAISHPDHQPKTADPCENMNCSDICLQTKDSARCVCRDGFKLMADERACEEETSYYYRAVLTGTDYQLCLADVRSLVDVNSSFPVKCFYNHTAGETISFVDVLILERRVIFATSNTIYSINMDAESPLSSAIVSTLDNITGLSVDWTDESIYYCTIAGQIRLKAFAADILLLDGIDQPSNLLVLPLDSKMVWMSGSSGHSIEMASIDGSDRKVLVNSTHLKFPKSLMYDVHGRKFYWIDGGSIMFANFDGTGVDSKTSQHVTSPKVMTIYKDLLAVIRDKSDASEISVISQEGYFMGRITYALEGLIKTIDLIDPALQPFQKGPCVDDNGGCEQICIPVGRNRYCECQYGFVKEDNNCSTYPVSDNFLLVTDHSHSQIYQLDLASGEVHALDIPFHESPSGVLYNPLTDTVYWSVITTDRIYRAQRNGSSPSLLLQMPAAYSVYPYMFDLDRSTGNLYFTANHHDSSFNVNNSNSGVWLLSPSGMLVQLTHLGSDPSDIVLLPADGLMFWVDGNNTNRFIAKANMDGTATEIFITTDIIRRPLGLAIDYQDRVLYVTDMQTDMVYRCSMNRVCDSIFSAYGDYPFDVDIAGNFLYLTARNTPFIKMINKYDPSSFQKVAYNAELGIMESISAYLSTFNKQTDTNQCSLNNGKGVCSSICIPLKNGYTCACPMGVSLREDGRSCEDVDLCPKAVTNGILDASCDAMEGKTCQFTCNTGYQPGPYVSNVTCGSNAQWNYNTSNICTAVVCDAPLANGMLGESCDSQAGQVCQFTCNSGFTSNSVSEISCLTSGEWNVDVSTVCEAVPDNSASVIAGSVGAGTLTVIVIVVMLVFRTRLRSLICRKQPDRERLEFHAETVPNTYETPRRRTAESSPASVYDKLGEVCEGATGGKDLNEDPYARLSISSIDDICDSQVKNPFESDQQTFRPDVDHLGKFDVPENDSQLFRGAPARRLPKLPSTDNSQVDSYLSPTILSIGSGYLHPPNMALSNVAYSVHFSEGKTVHLRKDTIAEIEETKTDETDLTKSQLDNARMYGKGITEARTENKVKNVPFENIVSVNPLPVKTDSQKRPKSEDYPNPLLLGPPINDQSTEEVNSSCPPVHHVLASTSQEHEEGLTAGTGSGVNPDYIEWNSPNLDSPEETSVKEETLQGGNGLHRPESCDYLSPMESQIAVCWEEDTDPADGSRTIYNALFNMSYKPSD